jgi:hypothetical protein
MLGVLIVSVLMAQCVTVEPSATPIIDVNESISAISQKINNDVLAYIKNEKLVDSPDPSDKKKQLYEIINKTHEQDLDQMVALLEVAGSKNLTVDEKSVLKRVIIEEAIEKMYMDEYLKSKDQPPV